MTARFEPLKIPAEVASWLEWAGIDLPRLQREHALISIGTDVSYINKKVVILTAHSMDATKGIEEFEIRIAFQLPRGVRE